MNRQTTSRFDGELIEVEHVNWGKLGRFVAINFRDAGDDEHRHRVLLEPGEARELAAILEAVARDHS